MNDQGDQVATNSSDLVIVQCLLHQKDHRKRIGRFSWGRGHMSKTRVLLGPFHFPSQQVSRKVVPLQMWQMTLPCSSVWRCY